MCFYSILSLSLTILFLSSCVHSLSEMGNKNEDNSMNRSCQLGGLTVSNLKKGEEKKYIKVGHFDLQLKT